MPVNVMVCGPALGKRVRSLIGSRVGGSFTALTPNVKVSLPTPPSGSVTVMVIRALPNWLGLGVIVTVQSAPLPTSWIFWLGTKLGLAELAVTIRLAAGLSTSWMVKEIGPLGVSSLIRTLAIGLTVGGSFTGLTVTKKLVLALVPQTGSVTVSVMVAEPNWSASGDKLTWRSDPLPVKRMFSLEIKPGLEERPVTIRLAAAFSQLSTANGMATVSVSSSVV